MTSKSTDSAGDGAWQYALRLLAARDYTVARLREKLKLKGFAGPDIEAVIARLAVGRYVDDLRYAERFAGAAVASGKYFGYRLGQEMLRRGVPSDIAEQVVRQAAGEEGPDERIAELVERRFPGFSFSDAEDRERRRVVGFLQRRGFGISDVFRVLSKKRGD